MKILAIDTSSKICSVSILENNNVIIEKHSNDEKTHSQKLMPIIQQIFDESNLTLNDINLLACCIGPGSFTGIRIGVSTIKAFADVKKIPVIGITSLESLAYNVSSTGLIASIIDAKNDNVYFSLYRLSENQYTLIEPNCSDNINTIISKLEKYDTITLVGDGAMLHYNLIQKKIQNVSLSNNNLQTSINIGKSAFDKFNLGILGDSNSLVPIYLKQSQAERALNGEK